MLPVVCLPGLLSTAAVYDRILDPGLGGGPVPADLRVIALPDLDDFGAIAARIARDLPPRCVLVGHSMGSYLCLDLWRRLPGRIAGMALLSCTASADTPAATDGRMKAVRYAEKAGIAALARAMSDLTLAPGARGDAALLSQIVAMAEAVGIETFARHQAALAGRPDSTAILPGITCPVLAITGADDTVTPPAAGRALAEAVPDGRFEMIDHTGHLLPLEAPGALAARLRPFLMACAADGAGALA